MKVFIFGLFLIASVSAALLPSLRRERRDVLELSPPSRSYLLPTVESASTDLEASTESLTDAPSTVEQDEKGYEYRTVRRLKFRLRNRRDVSELSQQYLPPLSEYLPPNNVQDTEIDNTRVPQIPKEYLPPVEQQQQEEVEIISTNSPIEEANQEPTSELRSANEEEATPATEPVIEIEHDTAVLANDGYHYKQPEDVPDLKDTTNEYLPPLESAEIIVESVDPTKSAILASDGYHYRSVKRAKY